MTLQRAVQGEILAHWGKNMFCAHTDTHTDGTIIFHNLKHRREIAYSSLEMTGSGSYRTDTIEP